MRSMAFACTLGLFLCTPAFAQQLELNDAGGSLQSGGSDPLPGQPFVVAVGDTIDFTISGASTAPYILCTGTLAATSTQLAVLNNQYFDLDIPSVFIIGDAIGLTGALPPYYFVTNPSGFGNWSFPANSFLDGATLAFTAIVADPALAPFNLNITAAAAFEVTSDLLIDGDDNVSVFSIPSGPYTIYGQQFTDLSICTNGWMLFGQNYSAALGENNLDFLNGDPGQAGQPGPLFCVAWQDQITAPLPYAYTRAHEDIATRTLTISWVNGAYYPLFGGPSWGTITLTIAEGSGFPSVVFDYSQFTPAPVAAQEGLVGISAANTGSGGTVFEQDLVTAGTFNPIGPVGTGFTSWFQNFDGSGATPIEAIDVGGLVINALDVGGNGDWFVY
jgi:hypothetical protein